MNRRYIGEIWNWSNKEYWNLKNEKLKFGVAKPFNEIKIQEILLKSQRPLTKREIFYELLKNNISEQRANRELNWLRKMGDLQYFFVDVLIDEEEFKIKLNQPIKLYYIKK